MDLIELLQNRHSIRQYTTQSIPEDDLKKILQAALLSASSRAIRPWEIILVQDKTMLQKLSECRINSAKMLEGAQAAVVVIADTTKSDVWIEDCAIVMANMHLCADSLGLGSCWIQGRLRETPEGETTDAYVRQLLNIPSPYQLEAILSLGIPISHKPPTSLETLSWEKVHRETF